MAFLKFIFVLLILIPVAGVMIYILSRLGAELRDIRSNTPKSAASRPVSSYSKKKKASFGGFVNKPARRASDKRTKAPRQSVRSTHDDYMPDDSYRPDTTDYRGEYNRRKAEIEQQFRTSGRHDSHTSVKSTAGKKVRRKHKKSRK